MFTCRICRYLTELDDAICPTPSGWCICLRCYSRETATVKHVRRVIQDDVNREEGLS